MLQSSVTLNGLVVLVHGADSSNDLYATVLSQYCDWVIR